MTSRIPRFCRSALPSLTKFWVRDVEVEVACFNARYDVRLNGQAAVAWLTGNFNGCRKHMGQNDPVIGASFDHYSASFI